MFIAFVKHADGSSVSRLTRPDGVLIEMRGYGRAHRVPHDLAHAVAEREFGMDCGVYGSVAAGALYASVRVVSGRPRHDAAERSRRILRANGRTVGVAELMSGIVHRAVETGGAVPIREARQAWGVVSAQPLPWGYEDVARATGSLRALVCEWEALAPGENLALDWPRRLVSPVPAPAKVNDRSRVRRR
ncbi:MAG TPA: hypothetical protein VJT31_37985 [Rugosimonospora sp.]|nr:hypothetical protein [Rugosimonospora sp.]